MPVLPVHLQEAPEVAPQRPGGQEPHQLGPDVRVEGPVLQQGANKVDQLGVQDPGVLALDHILPDNMDTDNDQSEAGTQYLRSERHCLSPESRPVASSSLLRVSKSVRELITSGNVIIESPTLC